MQNLRPGHQHPEPLAALILGTLRGRYQKLSGIILYQTTSADTV